MPFLQAALHAILRNQWALILYAVVSAAAGWAYAGWQWQIEWGGWSDWTPAAASAARLGADLAAVIVGALLKSIAFAMIGKDLSRPLWKMDIPLEALKRFFVFWLILDLMIITSLRLGGQLQDALPSLAALLVVLSVAVYLVYVPVGAAVMFSGRFAWEELGEAVRPLLDEFGRTLLLVAIALMQFFFIMGMRPEEGGMEWLWRTPILAAFTAALDCLIFAGAWIICMTRREAEDDDAEF